MSTFGDNVARLRQGRDWSQRDLAARLGISKGTVGAWETKESLPSYDRVKEVARLFGVPVTALFSTRETRAEDDGDFSSVELRVYGHIAAGTPLEMEEGDYGFPCPSRMLDRHPRAFYLEVEGESMNRVLPNGALALVDPEMRDPISGGHVYAVCVNGDSATVKRVRVLENGLELDPDSTDPTFHPMVYDRTVEGTQTITIIGEVVWYSVPFDFEI